MLARLLQAITLAWLVAILGWTVALSARGQPMLAWAGATLIASLHAAVLGLEFLLLPWINRGDPAPRPTAQQLLRAWWGEVMTATLVFGWRQPFRSMQEPDHLRAELHGRRGVLLVHGFMCNRGVWIPWMRRLRASGVPFVALNLEPVLGSIERYPQQIEAALRRLEQATGVPPLIVAHSMGGLAVRAWFNAFEGDVRVHSIITIASPHHGTWMARFGLAHNALEMRPGGAWLAALSRREPASRRARFTCFYSHCDNIVMPTSTATLPGADNRHVPGVAHVHLVYQDAVFNEALGRLVTSPGAADRTR